MNRRKVHENYYSKQAPLLQREAAMSLNIDKTVMGEEKWRDTADRQDTDAFYSALSSNNANTTNYLQNLGKMMNVEDANAEGIGAMESGSKYGMHYSPTRGWYYPKQ